MHRQAQAPTPLREEAGIDHTEVVSPGGHSDATWLSNFPAYLRWPAPDWN